MRAFEGQEPQEPHPNECPGPPRPSGENIDGPRDVRISIRNKLPFERVDSGHNKPDYAQGPPPSTEEELESLPSLQKRFGE